MLVSSLSQRELEILTVALRYWRAQRAAGHVRRTDDPSVTPEAVDFLLGKLGAASWAPLSL